MPNYRRAHVLGGSFFFALVVHQRRRLFLDEAAVQLLGNVMRQCRQQWPYQTNAIVLLPDHLHTIWTLPRGDLLADCDFRTAR